MNPVKKFQVMAVLVLLAIIINLYLYYLPNRQVRRLRRRLKRQARSLGLTY